MGGRGGEVCNSQSWSFFNRLTHLYRNHKKNQRNAFFLINKNLQKHFHEAFYLKKFHTILWMNIYFMINPQNTKKQLWRDTPPFWMQSVEKYHHVKLPAWLTPLHKTPQSNRQNPWTWLPHKLDKLCWWFYQIYPISA